MAGVPPFPGFPIGVNARGSHFGAIARSIVYQQLASGAASSIFRRTCRLTPGRAFPRVEEVLSTPEEEFRAAGLSAAKTRAIVDLAAKCADGTVNLRTVSRMSDDEVTQMLTQVWGVGEWTAQMFLLFRLGRLDVMPCGDLAVRVGLMRLDGRSQRPNADEVLARAEPWRPLRSVATWVLYRLCDAD